MPASARDSHAAVPTCFVDWARNASPNPGNRSSKSGAAASGVTSRGAIPVPPVTITTSQSARATAARRARRIGVMASGTQALDTTC